MFSAMLMMVPQEAYAPLLVLAGLLMIVGLRGIAMSIVGGVLALALLGPFMDALIEELPPWVLAFLMVCFVLSMFRLIFGSGVANPLIARLLYDLLVAPFRFIRWLLHGFGPGGRTPRNW